MKGGAGDEAEIIVTYAAMRFGEAKGLAVMMSWGILGLVRVRER